MENGECLRAFGFEKTRRRGDEDGGQDDEEAYEFSNVVFDEFHENNQFTKRELRRVIQLLKALTVDYTIILYSFFHGTDGR